MKVRRGRSAVALLALATVLSGCSNGSGGGVWRRCGPVRGGERFSDRN